MVSIYENTLGGEGMNIKDIAEIYHVRHLNEAMKAKLYTLPYSIFHKPHMSILKKMLSSLYPAMGKESSIMKEYRTHRVAKVFIKDVEFPCVSFEPFFCMQNRSILNYMLESAKVAPPKVISDVRELSSGNERNFPLLIIEADKITDIQKCDYQLPPVWANKLYEYGETGMGYRIFSLIFRDGKTVSYITSNIVDFLKLPESYTYDDIIDVKRYGKYDEDIPQKPLRGLLNITCYYE